MNLFQHHVDLKTSRPLGMMSCRMRHPLKSNASNAVQQLHADSYVFPVCLQVATKERRKIQIQGSRSSDGISTGHWNPKCPASSFHGVLLGSAKTMACAYNVGSSNRAAVTQNGILDGQRELDQHLNVLQIA